MNKVRIIGILILLLTFTLRYYLDNENYGFWYGAAAGIGGVLAITGRIKKKVHKKHHWVRNPDE